MKKFLLVALLIFAMILIGCTNDNNHKNISQKKNEEVTTTRRDIVVEKKIYAGSQQRSCFVIKKLEDIDGFLNAAHNGDAEYIDKMAWAGKAFFITYDTRVLCKESKVYRGMVFITVLEGKFEGYSGYTFSKRIHSIKNL